MSDIYESELILIDRSGFLRLAYLWTVSVLNLVKLIHLQQHCWLGKKKHSKSLFRAFPIAINAMTKEETEVSHILCKWGST